jgi:hypothetical protein
MTISLPFLISVHNPRPTAAPRDGAGPELQSAYRPPSVPGLRHPFNKLHCADLKVVALN